MNLEAILQAAATLLASNRDASYTPEMAARDAQRMADELQSRDVADRVAMIRALPGIVDSDPGDCA